MSGEGGMECKLGMLRRFKQTYSEINCMQAIS